MTVLYFILALLALVSFLGAALGRDVNFGAARSSVNLVALGLAFYASITVIVLARAI